MDALEMRERMKKHFKARNNALRLKSRPCPRQNCPKGCSSFYNCCSDCMGEDAASGARGFSHFGKLAPGTARHELYRALLSSLLGATGADCNAEPETALFYNALSPHHRVQLLADLAAGLLCAETPLPPDTPAHHAALFAVHCYASTVLEVELDVESEYVGGYVDGYYNGESQPRPRQFTPADPPVPVAQAAGSHSFGVLGFNQSEEEYATEAAAQERTHALRHRAVKKAAKKKSNADLAGALASDASQAKAHGSAAMASQIDMDPLSFARGFAEAHHKIFAWPNEEYFSNGFPQRRPPAASLLGLPLVQEHSGAFALRGLLLTALREWHVGTAAAAGGCAVRLDLTESSKLAWHEAMDLLGLVEAPALNLTLSDNALLYTPQFATLSPEKTALIQRNAFALHTAFAATWTQRSSVLAERTVVALGPAAPPASAAAVTAAAAAASKQSTGLASSWGADAVVFGYALVNLSQSAWGNYDALEPRSYYEAVASEERLREQAQADAALKAIEEEARRLKGAGLEEEGEAKSKEAWQLALEAARRQSPRSVLWRRCWYGQLPTESHSPTLADEWGQDPDARLAACASLAALEDANSRAHHQLHPLGCACSASISCCQAWHHVHPKGGAQEEGAPFPADKTPDAWWQQEHRDSWGGDSTYSIMGNSQKKLCWYCLGDPRRQAQAEELGFLKKLAKAAKNGTAPPPAEEDKGQGEKLTNCSGCLVAKYCRPACQNAHHPEHKAECGVLRAHRKAGTAARCCAVCHKIEGTRALPKLLTCSRCKAVLYCSKDCQSKHWKKGGHKVECKRAGP